MTEATPPRHIRRWQRLATRLTPMNRGLVGEATETALAELGATYSNFEQVSVAAEDTCQGWQVPPGWEVDSARLYDPSGRIIADCDWHPLHVFIYSPPFSGDIDLDELQGHLMSDPDRPDSVPFHFRNQYRHWDPIWGFCLPHNVRANLPDGKYHVDIRTRFTASPLALGHQIHAGENAESVLLLSHIDHPGQCADGLMGCLAGHEVLERLAGRSTKLTYRMLTTVEIVGTVFYARDYVDSHHLQDALFLEMPGTNAPLVYAQSARGRSVMDRIVGHLLTHRERSCQVVGFRESIGNDEIALDVVGVGIPCGSLIQWPYPHYHTNADSPDKIDPQNFEDYIDLVQDAIDVLEKNARLVPHFKGLPCLAHPDIDLYLVPPRHADPDQEPNGVAARLLSLLPTQAQRASAVEHGKRLAHLRNVIPSQADARTTTLDLAELMEVPFFLVDAYTDLWVQAGLLEKPWHHPYRDHTVE